MTSSIIIFVIVLLVQGIAAAIAKKHEREKAAKEAQARSVAPSATARVRAEPDRQTASPRADAGRQIASPIVPPSVAVVHEVPALEVRQRPVLIQAPIHMPDFHSAEGEATASDLARTVRAIQKGMLRSEAPSRKPLARKPAQVTAGVAVRLSRFRTAANLKAAIIASEVLGKPVSLR